MPTIQASREAPGETCTATARLQWRTVLIALSCCCAVVSLAYWQTVVSLVKTWESSSYSHGYLVPAISAYLIWRRRQRWSISEVKPSYWALTAVAFAGVVWVLAYWGDVRIVQQGAFVGASLGCILAVLGLRVFRALLFPLLFLFLAVPFGESLVPPLQDLTAAVSVALLRLSQVPVVLEGHIITVPGASWEVAEACSGLRYLVSSFVLGVLFAAVVFRSMKRRLLFLFAAVAVAIVANCVRAYGIILLGYISGNRIAHGIDHIIYGWIFFLVVIIPLLAVGAKWSDANPAISYQQQDSGGLGWHTAVSSTLAAAACIFIVLLTAHVAKSWSAVDVDYSPVSFSSWVQTPWELSMNNPVSWISSSYLNPTTQLFESYELSGKPVHLYVGYYAASQHGPAIFSSADRLLDRHLIIVSQRQRTALIDGHPVVIREAQVRNHGGNQVIWTCYWIGDEFTTNLYRVKYLKARDALLRRPAVAAIIAISADYSLDLAEGRARVQDFLAHVSLSRVLRPTRH